MKKDSDGRKVNMKMEEEIRLMHPQTNYCGSHQNLQGVKNGFPWSPQRKWGLLRHCDLSPVILALNVWPPEIKENKCVVLSHQVCGHLSCQLQDTINTGGKGNRSEHGVLEMTCV